MQNYQSICKTAHLYKAIPLCQITFYWTKQWYLKFGHTVCLALSKKLSLSLSQILINLSIPLAHTTQESIHLTERSASEYIIQQRALAIALSVRRLLIFGQSLTR